MEIICIAQHDIGFYGNMITYGSVETIDYYNKIGWSVHVLYAIHLNDNSFCVLTNLDVTCSPNDHFITSMCLPYS